MYLVNNENEREGKKKKEKTTDYMIDSDIDKY